MSCRGIVIAALQRGTASATMTSVPLTADMSEIPEPRHSPNAHFLIGEVQSVAAEKGRLGGGMRANQKPDSCVSTLPLSGMPEPST